MQSWIPSRSTLISSALALTKCLELMLNLNYDNEIRLQLALETVADNFFQASRPYCRDADKFIFYSKFFYLTFVIYLIIDYDLYGSMNITEYDMCSLNVIYMDILYLQISHDSSIYYPTYYGSLHIMLYDIFSAKNLM